MKRFTLLLLSTALFSLPAPGKCTAAAKTQRPGLSVVLRDRAEVTGREVRLGDVARVEGGTEKEAAVLRALSLGRAPDPGYTRYITADQVAARLRTVGMEPARVAVRGAEGVLVRVKCLLLSGREVAGAARAFLEQALSKSPGEHRITDDEGPVDLLVPQGRRPPRLRPAWRGAAVTAGTAWVEVAVEVDGTVFARVPVSFTIHAFEDVLVAARDIERGETFDGANTRMERRETTAVRGRSVRDRNELKYLVARRRIPAGSILRKEDGYLPPLVFRGREVVVVVRKGSLTIHARGIARQNGTLGETVEVRNPDSGNTFRGVVAGLGRVEIRL